MEIDWGLSPQGHLSLRSTTTQIDVICSILTLLDTQKPSTQWRKPIHNPQPIRSGSEARLLQKPAQTPQSSDRPRSLNPQIYPSWWGDDSQVVEQDLRVDNHKQPKNTF